MEPATKFPDGPAKSNKSEAGTKGTANARGHGMQFHSGPGMQKSLNPAKNQPKTMRHLRG